MLYGLSSKIIETTGMENLNLQNMLKLNMEKLGYLYNEETDRYHMPQPFPSWTYNQELDVWDPPIPFPNDGTSYQWDEENQQWITP